MDMVNIGRPCCCLPAQCGTCSESSGGNEGAGGTHNIGGKDPAEGGSQQAFPLSLLWECELQCILLTAKGMLPEGQTGFNPTSRALGPTPAILPKAHGYKFG